MEASSIGVLHPGEMGSSLGACLVESGARACWASAGRSEATASRAREAGLAEVGDLAELVASCDRLVSVCPPSAAEELARAVRDLGFQGIYVDANAVAPETTRRMQTLFGDGDGVVDFVDGGIIGPPARHPGLTRLYLSGARAMEVAGWFSAGALDAIALDDPVGAASALKMVYAGWTKGSIALLSAVYATACAEGVDRAILAEWEKSIPDLPARVRGVPGIGRKAWRFEGEMREISATFEAAGLPGGFHQAAAEVYGRLAELKHETEMPDIDEFAAMLIR
jgi:3-hydroxyisobutyrate dehydrogenase-like beta-hydroxyacid dehydrogenase